MTDSCVTNGINFLSSNVRILNEQVGSLIEPVGGSCCAVDEQTITGSGLGADPLTLLTGQFPPNPQATGFLRETIVATNPFNPLTQTGFEVEVPHTTSGYGIVMGIGHTYTVGAEGSVISGGLTNSVNTAAANYATIGGGEDNTVESSHDVIAGGQNNTTLASHSAIVGGQTNRTETSHSFIGGGQDNTVLTGPFTNHCVIAGGQGNSTVSDHCFIGGGRSNSILGGAILNSAESVICGGAINIIYGNDANQSFIGAGNQNYIHPTTTKSFIGGGQENEAGMPVNGGLGPKGFITIGGGFGNKAYNQFAFIGGGTDNGCSGAASVICGGDTNTTNADNATIGGGLDNTNNGLRSVIGGGGSNIINSGSTDGTIAGGTGNRIGTDTAFTSIGGGTFNRVISPGGISVANTIAGGGDNTITDATSGVIAGGASNTLSGNQNFIGGGEINNIGDVFTSFATLCGGRGNAVLSTNSTICGGTGNTCAGAGTSNNSFIGGGEGNTASNFHAVIGGGLLNVGGGALSVIGGGEQNNTSANYSTVGGGINNTASGIAATVPGGSNNIANGDQSFAAGNSSQAIHDGSFVLADLSGPIRASSMANQMTMRFANGYRLFSDLGSTTGVTLPSGGGAWAAVSDKNLKANTKEVDNNEILNKLSEIPVYHYNYSTQEPDIKHIGVFAQDFHKQFGCGEKDTQIYTIDEAGVCIAAIKELHKQNLELRLELEELRQQIIAH